MKSPKLLIITPQYLKIVLSKIKKMAEVILVYPITTLDKKGYSIGLPLSILNLATLLYKKYSIKIIDQRVDRKWKITLREELKKEKPICVGISTMTGVQIHFALKTAKIIRELSPKSPIVFGGVHPTLLPKQTIQNKYVDIIVLGEGEKSFFELVEHLKNNKPIENIRGICFKKYGKIIINNPEFLDLNKIPEPPYHLINIKDYFLNLYTTRKALSLVTGKGCPHRCAFCYNVLFNKRIWRQLNEEEIIKRMRRLKKFGAESIDIVDDNFFTDMKRVNRFVNLLKKEKLGLKFVINCRADYIIRMGASLLKKLYDVGFHEFYIGCESGSDRILKLIKKDITVDQILKANSIAKEAGIRPIYSFIAGFPGETREDIKKTLNLMMRLVKENPHSSLTQLKVFTPFPGTELFDMCLKYGLKLPKKFEYWSNFYYNSASYEWRNKKDRKFLERLSYITSFLDQKTISWHLGKTSFDRFLIKAYSRVARFRCKYNIYFFTPEVSLMKFIKRYVH